MDNDKDSLISDIYSASFYLSLRSSSYSHYQRCQRIHLNFTDTLFNTLLTQPCTDFCLSIMQIEMSLEVKPISQNRDKMLSVPDIFSPTVRLRQVSELLYHLFIIFIFTVETHWCARMSVTSW